MHSIYVKNPISFKTYLPPLLTQGKFYSMRIILEISERSNVDVVTIVEKAKALEFQV